MKSIVCNLNDSYKIIIIVLLFKKVTLWFQNIVKKWYEVFEKVRK